MVNLKLVKEYTKLANGNKAIGYVASWEDETKVLKYFQDRSLY